MSPDDAHDADDRWDAFREAVSRGLDPERAARVAGLVGEPVALAPRDPPPPAGTDSEES